MDLASQPDAVGDSSPSCVIGTPTACATDVVREDAREDASAIVLRSLTVECAAPKEGRLTRKRKRVLAKRQKRREFRAEEDRIQAEREKDPLYIAAKSKEEEAQLLKAEEEKKERDSQYQLWLEREKAFDEKARLRKDAAEREAIKRKLIEEQKRKARESLEKAQAGIDEKRRRTAAEDAKRRQEHAVKEAERRNMSGGGVGAVVLDEWSNPLAPPNAAFSVSMSIADDGGTPRPILTPSRTIGQSGEECQYYAKTGACRYGDRCSRAHTVPMAGRIILLRNFLCLPAPSLPTRTSGASDGSALQPMESTDVHKVFSEFCEDALEEISVAGRVVCLVACCNAEPHIRGNVYVEYETESQALGAVARFDGRFYASRQVTCGLCPAGFNWRQAVCGKSLRRACDRPLNCNFLHILTNPANVPGYRPYAHNAPRTPSHSMTPRNDRPYEYSAAFAPGTHVTPAAVAAATAAAAALKARTSSSSLVGTRDIPSVHAVGDVGSNHGVTLSKAEQPIGGIADGAVNPQLPAAAGTRDNHRDGERTWEGRGEVDGRRDRPARHDRSKERGYESRDERGTDRVQDDDGDDRRSRRRRSGSRERGFRRERRLRSRSRSRSRRRRQRRRSDDSPRSDASGSASDGGGGHRGHASRRKHTSARDGRSRSRDTSRERRRHRESDAR
eukprot:Opistho-2@88358